MIPPIQPQPPHKPLFSVQWRGDDNWAVYSGATVYNFAKDNFIHEPRPSVRSDKFITYTRRSLQVCLEKAKELIVNKFLTKITNQGIL